MICWTDEATLALNGEESFPLKPIRVWSQFGTSMAVVVETRFGKGRRDDEGLRHAGGLPKQRQTVVATESATLSRSGSLPKAARIE
ncbi:hypothetical protein V6N13_040031 [Hibiscus sabdariffa]|uniref:Uncharacterized protein n=1 Tax=Hibiscus sabdariffa TaxID=183260 RepID=A0ABR2STZ7_9ROSI